MTNQTSPLSERDVRIQKAKELRAMGINPYAAGFDKKNTLGHVVREFGPQHIAEGESDPHTFRDIEDIIKNPQPTIQTAGRLTLFRSHGKLSFGRLMDQDGDVQLMFHRDMCGYGVNDKTDTNEIEKVLLIDAIHFSILKKKKSEFGKDIIVENLEVNQEIREYVDTLPHKKIIVTNADKNIIQEVLKGKQYDDIFTLNNTPSKKDPQFFEELLKTYKQYDIEQFLYVDHAQENVDAAKNAGIEGYVCGGVDDMRELVARNINPQSRTSTAPLQKEPAQFDFHANESYIQEHGLITNGKNLPYHPDAKAKATDLRKNMTKAEKKLRFDLLKDEKEQRKRQKPIDHFIADFYCPTFKLIIEVDGDSHDNQGEYDTRRSEILEMYGLIVLRFTNEQVLHELDTVQKKLAERKASFFEGGARRAEDGIITLPNDLTPYKLLQKFIDVGDFIGVRGELFRTHKGELTIFVSEFVLLSKAIRSLGDKFHGIGENKESAYRQRYLDMIHNRETLNRMKLRSTFLRVIREFYHKHDFLEVETPVLGHSASGAAAAPFITHHNDFDIEMYLRISPETALKMATVGGLERVFEVAKDFRNEGSSPAHHQEFTMIEHYAAYRTFEDNMRFTEQMFDYIFETIPELKKIVQVTNKDGITKQVDFTTPWARIDYIDRIKKDCHIDVSLYGPQDEEKLRAVIKENGHQREGLDQQATATMIDYLYKKVTRPKIVGPAFIYNYPKTMQPLARRSDENPDIVEQRQLLVNGIELIKTYSELVDPLQQQDNFDEQAGAVAKGDEEATSGDDEFVKAMEYGMPCQSGRGMGIARILSILTEQSNIRDVILFPMMKPEGGEGGKNASNPPHPPLSKEGTAYENSPSLLKRGQGGDFDMQANESYIKENGLISNGAHLPYHPEAKKKASELRKNMTEAETKLRKDYLQNRSETINRQKPIDHFIADFYCASHKLIIEVDGDVHDIPDATQYDQWRDEILELYGLNILRIKNNDILHNFENTTKKLDRLFDSYNKTNSPKQEKTDTNISVISFSDSIVTQAESLAKKYLTDTYDHCAQVGRTMRGFSSTLGQDENYRYVVGLLHDVDRDHIEKSAEKHLQGEFVEIVNELEISDTEKAQLIHDIRTHYPDGTGVEPENLVQKYLISVDELSGLIHAYSLMRPEGLDGMKRSSLKKKIKDKKFAAGVDREHVKNCEKYLERPLEEFAMDVVEKMNG